MYSRRVQSSRSSIALGRAVYMLACRVAQVCKGPCFKSHPHAACSECRAQSKLSRMSFWIRRFLALTSIVWNFALDLLLDQMSELSRKGAMPTRRTSWVDWMMLFASIACLMASRTVPARTSRSVGHPDWTTTRPDSIRACTESLPNTTFANTLPTTVDTKAGRTTK